MQGKLLSCHSFFSILLILLPWRYGGPHGGKKGEGASVTCAVTGATPDFHANFRRACSGQGWISPARRSPMSPFSLPDPGPAVICQMASTIGLRWPWTWPIVRGPRAPCWDGERLHCELGQARKSVSAADATPKDPSDGLIARAHNAPTWKGL